MKKYIFVFLFLFLILTGCNNPKRTLLQPQELSPTPTVTETIAATLGPTAVPTVTPTVTPMPDVNAPALSLFGEECMELVARNTFSEPGFIAIDEVDGDITTNVKVEGTVDENTCGTYILSYIAEDNAGNKMQAERTVIVKQPEVITPEGKVIYLTFDDGPGKYTDDLLEILAKYDIKATFFTCGNGLPELVTKIYEAGHTVGIHCRNHNYKEVYASEEAYFEDLFYMQDFIYECTGERTTLVRFPGGSSNTVSSFNPGIMTRLTEQLEQTGFQYFDWNVSSGDSGTKDTEAILQKMISETEKRKCVMLLQHVETRKFSLDAVEDYIVWAIDHGYTFMKVDETSPRMHHTVAN